MVTRSRLTAMALITVVALPAAAQEHRQRSGTRRNPSAAPQAEERAAPERAEPRERAVPRQQEQPGQQDQPRVQQEARRNEQSSRSYDDARRDNRSNNGRYDNNNNNNGRYGNSGRYDNYRHAVPRRYPVRVVRPTVVHVIPYRPYVYRPSYGHGVYYGYDNYYPYGYTPRGYYDPIPGRPYGGVRITGAPRDARVFADGYFVGLVDDFDGIFQHMNLEAGPHRIEIDLGYDAIEFNVYVRPGETTTFRAARH
jgi:hypothetical protein